MSIHPAWAQRILDGHKTVEVRRRPPDAPGALLVLYATAPRRAVLACATIRHVRRGSPAALWERLGAQSEMRKGEFLDYLAGASAPGALELTDVAALVPRALSFRAPQSWMWLNTANPRHFALIEAVRATLRDRPPRLRGSR